MPLIANIVGLVTCLLRSVWVLILSNSYHFAVRHSSIENGRFSLSDLICALTFGFFLLLCILFILLFIYTLCVYLLLDFFNLIKGPEGTVCFVVVAHNMEEKMLQWHKFVAKFHVYAKVWNKFWGMVQVTLYWSETYEPPCLKFFSPH